MIERRTKDRSDIKPRQDIYHRQTHGELIPQSLYVALSGRRGIDCGVHRGVELLDGIDVSGRAAKSRIGGRGAGQEGDGGGQ